MHSFTIIEGWTANELIENLSASDFISNNDKNIESEWDIFVNDVTFLEAEENIEGLFLPETYLFAKININ